MKRFVEGVDRSQSVLFPERLDDYIDEDNPVRVVDVFVDELELGELGFGGVTPAATGRPAYHRAPADVMAIAWSRNGFPVDLNQSGARRAVRLTLHRHVLDCGPLRPGKTLRAGTGNAKQGEQQQATLHTFHSALSGHYG